MLNDLVLCDSKSAGGPQREAVVRDAFLCSSRPSASAYYVPHLPHMSSKTYTVHMSEYVHMMSNICTQYTE